MIESWQQRILRKCMGRPFAFKVVHRLASLHRLGFLESDFSGQDPKLARGYKAGQSPVFISSRYRSGSTFLWQFFAALDGCTAYYEPFNEARWFDKDAHRGAVDPSHRGAVDYHLNYDKVKGAGAYFDDRWNVNLLALGAASKVTGMKEYLDLLIDAAAGQPILQFNRVDFRLPWLRRQYPDAFIMHLHRNPRDVWASMLRGQDNDPNWSLLDFEPLDQFYLMHVYRDLSLSLPSILRSAKTTHPYEIHYLIWLLSNRMAALYADYSLNYDDLASGTEPLEALLQAMGKSVDSDLLTDLYSARPAPYSHDDGFYSAIEERVDDAVLHWLGPIPAFESGRQGV